MYLLPQNAQRAKNITIVFFIMAVIQLLATASNVVQLSLIQKIAAGNYNVEEATANDLRQLIIVYTHLAVYIACVVFFILWFRRAYHNLYLSNRVLPNFVTGWAAGAWFVPFVNLGRPYSIMKEIWIKTQHATDGLLSYKPAGIVGFWWALWIANFVTANVASRGFKGNSIEDLTNRTYANIVSDVVELAALIVAILMIKQTAALEENLQQSLLAQEQVQTEDVLNFIV